MEEKNQQSRVQGCQLSPHLPFTPALPWPRRGKAEVRRVFTRLSQSLSVCWHGGRRQRKFSSYFCPPSMSWSPGQRGFPGADLKAAWPSLDIARPLLCPSQCGVLLGEPRLTPLKIHGVFLPFLLINPLGGLGGRMDSGKKGSRRRRRKAPPFPDAFTVPLAGVRIYSRLGICLEGGWQGICAKTISDLFKKKVTKPSIVSGQTVCLSFKHWSAGNLNIVGAGKSERETKAIKH